jgi:hypothetical protein
MVTEAPIISRPDVSKSIHQTPLAPLNLISPPFLFPLLRDTLLHNFPSIATIGLHAANSSRFVPACREEAALLSAQPPAARHF